MKISTKKELQFCLMADRMMNRGRFTPTLKQKIKSLVSPDYVMDYLVAMRKCAYYKNGGGIESKLKYFLYAYRMKKIGIRLGFSIGCDVLGYGVVIPHYGTIVVGNSNRIGHYAVLHTSTCISDNNKRIGNALYLATGAKLTSPLTLGDNVSIGANSLVNKSFPEGNVLIGGMPASAIRRAEPWYIRDSFEKKVQKVESLKQKMNINL